MPERTGTASQVDASGGNGSTAVTVPADATGVIAFWSHYDGTASNVATLTLNGVGFTIQTQLGTDGSLLVGCGIATLLSPATGSQTFAWTYSAGAARDEGGWIVLVYVKNLNASTPFRAAAVDQDSGTNAVSVAPSSQATDLVLAFCQAFNGVPGNPSFDVAATTFINNAVLNSEVYDIGEITTPGAGSTAVGMNNEDSPTIGAISLPVADSYRAQAVIT